MARRQAGAFFALALLTGLMLVFPAPVDAAAGARIVTFQILETDGSVAERPLDRGRAYRYRVRYRIGGAPSLRVGRALTLIAPDGQPALLVRPPGRLDRAGRFTARGPLRLTRSDPPGLYRVRYALLVRDPASGDSVRRQRTLGVRFRNPGRS